VQRKAAHFSADSWRDFHTGSADFPYQEGVESAPEKNEKSTEYEDISVDFSLTRF